jgi:hypothetical protein
VTHHLRFRLGMLAFGKASELQGGHVAGETETGSKNPEPGCSSFINLNSRIINSLARSSRYNLLDPMSDEPNVLK